MNHPPLSYLFGDRSSGQLSALAGQFTAEGKRVVGALPLDPNLPSSKNCDMDIRIIPGGASFRISQSLGQGSAGCRLDAGALEMAAIACAAELAKGADILILNKFGKLEAEGRGFCPVIAEAISASIPVILGVNRFNLDALLEWSGGLARELELACID
ncbi:MAG: DUF2478 domain-containing protein [Rhodobacteraceae bacterium]|nr:DUF2478 domain-containing protein [Paracoccaceae bacterium]